MATLKEVMQKIGKPAATFKGSVTNDDNVLAIDISADQKAEVDEYAVVQGYITGVDAQVNAESSDKAYIRGGKSTTKVGTQRTFKATGDRYIGDEFQDYVFDRARMYGVGEAAVVNYVWFCALNGLGEKGQATIMVNSDGSGNAGETAGIDVELRKIGAMPDPFTYEWTDPTPGP